jgi:hypothetical protein
MCVYIVTLFLFVIFETKKGFASAGRGGGGQKRFGVECAVCFL